MHWACALISVANPMFLTISPNKLHLALRLSIPQWILLLLIPSPTLYLVLSIPHIMSESFVPDAQVIMATQHLSESHLSIFLVTVNAGGEGTTDT